MPLQAMKETIAHLNTWYHEEVRFLRVIVSYLVIVILALGITLPPLAVVRHNSRQNHRDAAQLAAANLCGFVEGQVGQMYGALDQFRGFAASGAPLRVPRYFVDSVSTRVQIAMSTGTPGALNEDGYYRILGRLNSTVYGYQNALVQPGVVNLFAPDTSTTKNRDWLNFSAQVTAEYFYIVTTTNELIYGPSLGSQGNTFTVAIRAGVFSDLSRLVRGQPDLVDATTGQHPNWKYLWGGIVVVVNLFGMAAESSDVLAGLATPGFHYLFESRPRHTEIGNTTNFTILGNTTEPVFFDEHDAVAACVDRAKFDFLCFRVIPRSAVWDGDDLSSALIVASILCVVVPLLATALVLSILRLVLGPKRDPLRNAPLRTPFHAVCIDMTAAHRMWAEVPFVMNDVTTIFTMQLERTAKDHEVFIAARLGNTVIVASAHRHRIVNFTRAMCAWSQSYRWPPHIAMHCPQHSVAFSYVIHTCEDALVRLEPSGPTSFTYDVTGPDIQVLLFLRIAAIPGHIICTGHFLEVQSRDIANAEGPLRPSEMNPLGPAAVALSEVVSVDVQVIKREARPLGVCELPLPGDHGRRTFLVQGFLLESAATRGRALHELMDSFPDWVWAEWKARAHDDDRAVGIPSDDANSFVETPQFDDWLQSSGHRQNRDGSVAGSEAGRGRNSSLTASIVATNRFVTTAHINNTMAAEMLPGSAVDLWESQRLARAVFPLLTGARQGTALNNVIDTQLNVIQRLRQYTSLASYFLMAYRVVFGPIDHDSRQSITAKICGSLGISSTDDDIALAARCARVCQVYLDDLDFGAFSEN
jgi:hypothetical protein